MLYFAILAAALFMAASAEGVLPPEQIPSKPPGQGEQVPPGLAPAIEALRKGDAAAALTVARKFVKAQPGSALGHEVLGEAARRRQQWGEAEQALGESLRLEPGRVTALLRLGYVALGMRDGKKSEERFRQAIVAAPQLAAAHRGLARALMSQGNLVAAINTAEQAVKLSLDQEVEARLELASLYYDAGRLLDAERLLSQILAAQPDLKSARLLQGIVSLDLGKTDEASALFEKVAARDPRSVWARLGRAFVQRARGQLPQARAELEKLVKEHPDWSLGYMELGRTLLLQQQPSAALKVFDEGERISSDARQSRLRSARLLLAMGHTDLAIERAQSLLDDAAVAPAARRVLVQAYLQHKAPEQAERVLREAVDASPQDPTGLLQLGRFYLERARARDALIEFDRAAAVRPDAPEPLLGKAEAHAALGESDAAVAAAERVVNIQNQSPESYVFLALIQQRLGRSAEAVQAFRAALAKNPNHLGALRGLAAQYDRDGQRSEAVKLLQDAVNAHPQSVRPLLDLGALLKRHGQTEAAVTAYREGLRRVPDDPALLNNLAYLLAKTPKNLPEAATLSERAYKKAPRNASIADTYGWILFQQGSVKRALPPLQEAARLAPASAEIQYHLGAAYARLGKRAEARRALEQALQGPRLEDASAARKLLDSLR
jgi:tetratricopeptide (TPR) repeat protein